MPSRLSQTPLQTARTSSSPKAMALSTASRPILDPHFLIPSVSLISSPGGQSHLQRRDLNFSRLVLPPLQNRLPHQPDIYPNELPRSDFHGTEWPTNTE